MSIGIENMASLKPSLLFFVLVHAFLLLPNSVLSNDNEDNLLQGINSYRQSQRLQPLVKNGKADYLADQIAEEMEDQPCTTFATGANIEPSTATQFIDYPKLLKKCKIDANTTTDAVILPVCVPSSVPTLLLTNYTHTPYAKHLNNSKYTGAGLGSEDDWMVVVLTTSTPAGSTSGAVSSVSKIGFGHCLLSLVLGLTFFVLSGSTQVVPFLCAFVSLRNFLAV